MLYFTTWFVQMSINMNEDLTQQQENQPMDWRFRNLLISYIIYYVIVLTNFVDCCVLWYLLAIFFVVIV